MRKRLAKKPELAEHLIPKWPVGCRRLTPGIGFLEALCEDNVNPIFSDIAAIDETGIITKDGKREEYDVIICATGFDVSYGARFDLVGRNGAVLDAKYADNPISYMAIAVPGFPVSRRSGRGSWILLTFSASCRTTSASMARTHLSEQAVSFQRPNSRATTS